MAEQVILKPTGLHTAWETWGSDGNSDLAELILDEASQRFTRPLDSIHQALLDRLETIMDGTLTPGAREDVKTIIGLMEDLNVGIQDLVRQTTARLATNIGPTRGTFEAVLQETARRAGYTPEGADEEVRNAIGLRAREYALVFPGFTLALLHVGEEVKLTAPAKA